MEITDPLTYVRIRHAQAMMDAMSIDPDRPEDSHSLVDPAQAAAFGEVVQALVIEEDDALMELDEELADQYVALSETVMATNRAFRESGAANAPGQERAPDRDDKGWA